MISRAVSARSANHADPDVDRPSGYAYGCAQITRFGTASGDRHSDLIADHIGRSRTVAAASERDAALSWSPKRFAMSSRTAYRPVVMAYAPVNGLQLYYEVHGSERPLVLLHGGLMTIDLSFGPLLEPLAASRQVIAVELQGMGIPPTPAAR